MKPFSVEESENIQKVNDALIKQNQELKKKMSHDRKTKEHIFYDILRALNDLLRKVLK